MDENEFLEYKRDSHSDEDESDSEDEFVWCKFVKVFN